MCICIYVHTCIYIYMYVWLVVAHLSFAPSTQCVNVCVCVYVCLCVSCWSLLELAHWSLSCFIYLACVWEYDPQPSPPPFFLPFSPASPEEFKELSLPPVTSSTGPQLPRAISSGPQSLNLYTPPSVCSDMSQLVFGRKQWIILNAWLKQ